VIDCRRCPHPPWIVTWSVGELGLREFYLLSETTGFAIGFDANQDRHRIWSPAAEIKI
jgi:hypothetical protein